MGQARIVHGVTHAWQKRFGLLPWPLLLTYMTLSRSFNQKLALEGQVASCLDSQSKLTFSLENCFINLSLYFQIWELALRLCLGMKFFILKTNLTTTKNSVHCYSRSNEHPVQLSFSHVRLFVTPWTAAHQASLSITNSQSLLKLMSIESVTPSNHLIILCCPLLLPPSIFPSIRVSSKELVLPTSGGQNISFSISPSNEYLKTDFL